MHSPRPVARLLIAAGLLAAPLATAALPSAADAAPAVTTAGTPASPASPTSVTARASAVRVTPLWFDVTVGSAEDGVRRCTIVADLYTPRTASASRRVPAVLATNGFGGSKDDQAGLGRYLAGRGYAVLSYSGLGFGGSSCPISLDSPVADGRAARFLVSYLGGQTGHAFLDAGLTRRAPRLDVVRRDARDHAGRRAAFDPRVGLIGGSYGGGNQFAVASIDPRVDALVPLITWNDLSYSLAPNDVVANGDERATGVTTPTHGAAKLLWAGGFSALGVANGLQNAQDDQQRLLGCPNFETWVCPSLVNAATTGSLDDATFRKLHSRSVASFLRRITVPTLLMQGQGDTLFNLNEADATFRALRAQGTPVKLVWSDGGHSNPYPTGEIDLDAPDARTQYLVGRAYAWFERYLRDREVPTGPTFAYFRDWVRYSGNAKPAYATSSAYPVAGSQRLVLDGSTLTGSPAASPASQMLVTPIAGLPTSYDTPDVVGGSFAGLPALPTFSDTDAPGTAAAWTSAPLTAPLTVVGSPVVDLRADAPTLPAGQPLTLFLKVLDVAPDGTASVVRDLISPARVGDATKPFTVRMPAFAHRFEPGHAVRLVVAGGAISFRGGLLPVPVTIPGGGTVTLPTP
ncbi:alpha/beta fold hydrolase [Nocardioides sp. TRM66260-LWL]|uniref:alpha/beta fold hydrolase n=1 Tax=Nocardioides sp. TRM66260-LWL TaxID=2874478 RepID=UPI001CC58F8D|nr:alpha/beta fold hydrolase [Nocardioides sp. TRM66260-LWL]MBZ5734690.1 alpha/beta fold hydrolase [Nocardioides sp. TRM66260-LWL]